MLKRNEKEILRRESEFWVARKKAARRASASSCRK